MFVVANAVVHKVKFRNSIGIVNAGPEIKASFQLIGFFTLQVICAYCAIVCANPKGKSVAVRIAQKSAKSRMGRKKMFARVNIANVVGSPSKKAQFVLFVMAFPGLRKTKQAIQAKEI